jgi:hypothetical protein
LCIEYDGRQHFTPVDYFGGQEAFERQQAHDKIKSQWCETNKVALLRISGPPELLAQKVYEMIVAVC